MCLERIKLVGVFNNIEHLYKLFVYLNNQVNFSLWYNDGCTEKQNYSQKETIYKPGCGSLPIWIVFA